MKRISKLFAVVSAMAILLSAFFAFPASAASVRFSAGNVSGAKGETVTVNVNVSGDAKIWGTVLELKYNASQLQYISSSNGSLASSPVLPHNNGTSVKYAGNLVTDKVKNGGTVFSVKFKILMESGTSTLALSATENIDYNANAVSASVSNGSVKVTKPVTGITLNTNSVSLKKGSTAQLTATVTPSDATNKTVTYTTSNSKVATVNSAGKITAVGGGTATITANAGSKTATCKVSVTVPQTGIKASGNTTRTVGIGSTMKLSVLKVPSDATDNYSVTWTCADTNVATVSSNGTVKGIAIGETTVTAKSNNWTVTYKIKVVEKTEETTTEPLSEESTSDVTETEASTEATETAPIETTTEPVTESEKGFFGKLFGKDDNGSDNTVSKGYHYIMLAVVAVITAAVSIPVTFFVTAGYYKKKNNER